MLAALAAVCVGWGAAAAWVLRTAGAAPSLPAGPGLARAPSPALAAVPALPRYQCRRAPGPIRLDGVLDDPGWRRAASTGPFPNWNARGTPEYPTEARLAYDAGSLYIAFSCKDRDIYSPYRHRDDPLWNQDVVELFVSAGGDPRHYDEFEVSPANVLFDAKIFNPGGSGAQITGDRAWNAAGLETAVRVDGTLNRRDDSDRGWTVELRLPFAALGLRRAPVPGTSWRVNLYRIDPSSANGFAAWSPTLGEKPDFHRPERFGYLKFAR